MLEAQLGILGFSQIAPASRDKTIQEAEEAVGLLMAEENSRVGPKDQEKAQSDADSLLESLAADADDICVVPELRTEQPVSRISLLLITTLPAMGGVLLGAGYGNVTQAQYAHA